MTTRLTLDEIIEREKYKLDKMVTLLGSLDARTQKQSRRVDRLVNLDIKRKFKRTVA